MIIRKNRESFEILINNQKILFDPLKIQEDGIVILSDINKNINTNKFFNLPGEYEVNNIYIRGYAGDKNIIFVLRINDLNLIYLTENLSQELLNEIFNKWGEIDIALLRNKLNDLDKIKNKLKLKIMVELENKNNLKGEKAKEIKINSKKLEEKNYLLI